MLHRPSRGTGRRTRWGRALLPVIAGSFVFACGSAWAAPTPVDGEIALEGRLWAPCCLTQTLDVHDSEIATAIRTEIHARLGNGEAAGTIEDDLAARYGERIRAVPKGRDSRKAVPALIALGMLISAMALWAAISGWRRRARFERESDVAPTARDAYDERLDEELSELDN